MSTSRADLLVAFSEVELLFMDETELAMVGKPIETRQGEFDEKLERLEAALEELPDASTSRTLVGTLRSQVQTGSDALNMLSGVAFQVKRVLAQLAR